jgi:hypothetical protein
MIKKFINWVKNLESREDASKSKIKTVCEKHLDTFKKTCPSCREAANG